MEGMEVFKSPNNFFPPIPDCFEVGARYDRTLNTVHLFKRVDSNSPSPEACHQRCLEDSRCQWFSWRLGRNCYLSYSSEKRRSPRPPSWWGSTFVSGVRNCTEEK